LGARPLVETYLLKWNRLKAAVEAEVLENLLAILFRTPLINVKTADVNFFI
jgi:hypothetical protein